jgi:hypothetical protein
MGSIFDKLKRNPIFLTGYTRNISHNYSFTEICQNALGLPKG